MLSVIERAGERAKLVKLLTQKKTDDNDKWNQLSNRHNCYSTMQPVHSTATHVTTAAPEIK